MVTEFVEADVLGHILFALTHDNCLVCKVALETGLRVGDILKLKSSLLENNSFTIIEEKTNKKRTVTLSDGLVYELKSIAGKNYVFEHRTDSTKHRTRQAVYKDIKRACKLFRIKENVSPHSLRKAYAVDLYRECNDLNVVMQALNHNSELVTMLYAMADILKKRG